MEQEFRLSGSEFCAWVTAYHNQVKSDVVAELQLPDYHRDVKRVLCVREHFHLDGHYYRGDRLEYEGVLHLSVLYIAEDDSVENATFSVDVADGAVVGEEQAEQVLQLTPAVLQSNYRVLGPRKIQVKTKIGVQILLRHRECIAPRMEGEHSVRDEQSLQYATAAYSTMEFLSTQIKDQSVSHTLEANGTLPPIGQLCYHDASLRIEESRAQGEGLACRGSLFLSCLYRAQGGEEGGEYVSLCETVPVSFTVEESFPQEYAYRVVPRIRKKNATVSENAYGEARLVEMSVEYDLDVEAAKNVQVQAVTDLYSTAFETEPQRKKMAVPTLTGVYHANLSVHEGKSRTELGLEAAQSVLLVCAEPQIEKIDYHKEKGRLTVEGTARCNALLSCGTDAPCLDAAFPLPFRFELSGIFMEGDAEYRYDCYVVSSSGRLDSTQLYPNLELGLDILVSSVEEKELVESVSLVPGAPIAPCEQMIFCYPSAQQSLWEIAKEYHVSVEALKAVNRIEGEGQHTRVLLIPKNT